MAKTTNGMTAEKAAEAASFLARCENIAKETESEKGKFMAFCKEQKKAEKEVLTEAKAAGFSTKALKGLLKQRQLSRKIDAISDGFDIDDESQYQLLEEKLGGLADLPLGQAAVAAAKKKPVGDAKNSATVN